MTRRVPVLLQSEASECGLACVAMIAGAHGLVTDLPALRRRWALSLKGVTLTQLIGVAASLELSARALRADVADLGALRTPAVLHWNLDHFVVLERVRRRRIDIVDPACGRRSLSIDQASAHFTGIALELTPTDRFERRRDAAPLPLRAFFRGTGSLGGALTRLLLLSLALQAFVLAAPLFGQVVVDEIAVGGDRDLLTALGVAFLLLAAIQACIDAARGGLVIALGAALQLGWAARLFHHLVRLPLAWFERRHVGDVVSRFGSLRAVESLVTRSVVAGVVDGVMAATTVALMLWYDPVLAAVSAAAVAVYAALRAALLPAQRRVAADALALDARQGSQFIETVRAMLPLKAYAREAVREASWRSRKSDAVDADAHAARLQLAQHVAHTALFAMENVAVLWLGALAVLDARITLGMLVAFIAYKNQFAARAAALVDHAVTVALARVHLDRIADIALAEPDPGCAQVADRGRFAGALAVHDLRFRYADTEPPVIDGLSLRVAPGECVALSAPSGRGKTTLVKLLAGLLEPASGRVCVDGVDVRGVLPAYRRATAAVMQDDALLAGTLADNITLFDARVDERRLHACATLAAIHDDIVRMPMGYLTLVGDMGSALSGGQRQRVLLARALYARPRILFLDEATSHLDLATEARIHAALRRLTITRVVVAHRPETLAVADRVIELG